MEREPATRGSAGSGTALRRPVLGYGRTGLRPFPWRATRDPWAVLVSEVMLQQTQAGRVVEPYGRFLGRFPTPRACARAGVGEVLRAWAGLGYNRRARSLHGAARAIVECHGGAVPDDVDALVALPGVGPYTARAVLAFAFERDVGVVDVNVARVLARAVAGAALEASESQRLADSLVPRGHGWSWNQSLMEIGATACVARDPACGRCSLGRCCAWAGGSPGSDPARAAMSDPARRAVRQTPFEGSDRQGRGRLVDALRHGPVHRRSLSAACGWPDQPERARRVARALVCEGLARQGSGGYLVLP